MRQRVVPAAWWGGLLATGLLEVVDLTEDPGALDRGGCWFVVADFEAPLGEASAVPAPAPGGARGRARAWRFADVRPAPPPVGGSWWGPERAAWTSATDRAGYTAAVAAVRDLVREGVVYQATVCRVLEAALPSGSGRPDPWALATLLRRGNAAPYAGVLDLGDEGFVVSASPELYLRRRGEVVESGPIKGTAPPGGVLGGKDVAENVMITDLVRNDLQRVCRPGTVAVTSLLARERHPGLDHLVSTVAGRLRSGTGWGELLAATFPPGSVSGAPKRAALQAVAALEPVVRGPYCGALGWVDADRGTGELAVGIRTFAARDGVLRFGTGAGITWGSDPEAEWAETELKAARLLALASSPAAVAAGPPAWDGPGRARAGHHAGMGQAGTGQDGSGDGAVRAGGAVEAADPVVWVDGTLRTGGAGAGGRAVVDALDHGMTTGDGVFETCKVLDGVPFALGLHLARLARSAAGLGLPAPDEDRVRSAVEEVLAARPLARGRLRLTWTSGPGPLGSERHGGSTLVVAAAPSPPPAPSPSVVTVPWTRNERSATAGLKTTSYAENVVALRHALAAGAGEALLANTRGELCEGTGSNVVVQLRDEQGRPVEELVTPPLSSGCLAGVTRGLLLAWAEQEGLPLVERAVPLSALGDVEAVLLTSSLRDVQVQRALDGRPLATSGLPARAVELFARRAAQDPDPR